MMPKTDELLFALKTFAGAMTALWISLWLGLENPYWAMATAFIVAQPLTGAMRSKAVYRFIGTLVGATAAVAIIPNLVNAPLLASLAMALWVGFCLYLSLLDRTPRAYMFMLAGYTAGIIGFPSVAAPGLIFQTALTRVEEIYIGIACTTVAGTVFFPRGLGPVLARRVAGWVRPGIEWATAALEGRCDAPEVHAARRKLAMEATDVAMMTTQLAYDTSNLQSAVPYITQLRIYMLSMMPVLSSIGDRVAQLRRHGGITPALQKTLDATAVWMQIGGPEDAGALHGQIRALEDSDLSWTGLLRASLAMRLSELVSIIHHERAIRRHVFDGDVAPQSAVIKAEFIAVAAQLRDHGLALFSALSTALAILLVCAVWIVTAWPAGAGAAVMVAVAGSFFAAQDDPAPAIALMSRNAVIATLGSGFYTFLVLPRMETFAELALVLLPAGLIIGILVSRPATFGTGMLLGAIGSTNLALDNTYSGNFATYLNNTAALLLGITSALVVTRLIRSVGAAWSARRVIKAGWRDIAAAAGAKEPGDPAVLSGRMLDRFGLLVPRLASIPAGTDIAAADVLQDLRVGLNVIGLQRCMSTLSPQAQAQCAAVLEGVAAHYRANPLAPPPPGLLTAIDEATHAAAFDTHVHKEALMMLSGLRSVLFAPAPPPALAGWTSP